mmetsp:Transcript_17807/g.41319  ORF Transcript_17807/g.41319 Transcript_17807/m.41319 type:complete len:237 (-) Transcript_17807:663-1373(-)
MPSLKSDAAEQATSPTCLQAWREWAPSWPHLASFCPSSLSSSSSLTPLPPPQDRRLVLQLQPQVVSQLVLLMLLLGQQPHKPQALAVVEAELLVALAGQRREMLELLSPQAQQAERPLATRSQHHQPLLPRQTLVLPATAHLHLRTDVCNLTHVPVPRPILSPPSRWPPLLLHQWLWFVGQRAPPQARPAQTLSAGNSVQNVHLHTLPHGPLLELFWPLQTGLRRGGVHNPLQTGS